MLVGLGAAQHSFAPPDAERGQDQNNDKPKNGRC